MFTSSLTLRTNAQSQWTKTLVAAAALFAATGCANKTGSSSDTGETLDEMSESGDLEVMAEYSGWGYGMESDEDNLYVLAEDRVLSISKRDGSVTELAEHDNGVHLEQDDDNLYVMSWNAITSVPKSGGALTTLVSGLQSSTGSSYGFDMETDGTNIYTVALGVGTDTVSSVPLDGSEPTSFGTLLEDAYYVQVDDDYVYVATGLNHCTIYRAPKSGGELEELASSESIHLALTRDGNTIPEMEIHDGKLYWANQYHNGHGLGTIAAIPLDGGPIEELAVRQNSPQDLVFHDGDMFWINGGDTWKSNGELMRLESGATEAEILVSGLRRPEYLQVDDDYIYVTAYDAEMDGFDFDIGHVYRIER